MLRSTAYPRKEAIVAPAPGSTPIKNPWIDWRPITGAICFASSRVMRRSLISPPASLLDRAGSSTRYNASGKANIAIASVIKPKPDCKSIMPIVNRGALNNAPSPTVAMIRPNKVINKALPTWPVPAKAAMADKPTTISAKYSAE